MQRICGRRRSAVQRITDAPMTVFGAAGRVALAMAVLVLIVGSAPSALAAPGHVLGGSFGTSGTGPGTFSTPAGVTVAQATHDVFVADQNNGRVQRFTSDGTFLSSFDGSGTPDGSMAPSVVAFDESSGSVYVADAARPVVNKFDLDGTYVSQIVVSVNPFAQVFGLAVDPTSGDVYVSNFDAGGVVVYDDAGAFQRVITGEGTDGQLGVAGAVTVDGAGNLYVADSSFVGAALVKQFATDGSYVSTVYQDSAGGSIAADPVNGDLFVFDLAVGLPQIVQFDNAGARQFAFGTGEIGFPGFFWSSAPGVGVDHDSGRVYVADQATNRIVYFDAVTLPDVITGAASDVTATGATLSGSIDPLGVDTTYHFDYGLTPTYGASTPEIDAGSGIGAAPVDGALSALQPNQLYHYRLVGANEFGTNSGQDQTLTTDSAPPSLDAQPPFASNIRAFNVRLNATVNPNNLPTTYHFEYGTTAGSLGSSTPSQGAGSGFGDLEASQLVTGLDSDTTYFFRVVADNGTGGPTAGTTGSFTTPSALPTATIQPVTDVTAASTRLHAIVDSRGLAGTARFNVQGIDSAYSSLTPEAALEAGGGEQAVSAVVSDLPAGQRFRVRAIVTTGTGTAQSEAAEFGTPARGFSPLMFQGGGGDAPYGCGSPQLTGYRGHAKVGRMITVLGSDLGLAGVLRIGSKVADTSRWTSTAIRMKVPNGVKGRVQLRVACANLSNSLPVRVAAPKVKPCRKGTSRKTVKRGGRRVTKCVKRPKRN